MKTLDSLSKDILFLKKNYILAINFSFHDVADKIAGGMTEINICLPAVYFIRIIGISMKMWQLVSA